MTDNEELLIASGPVGRSYRARSCGQAEEFTCVSRAEGHALRVTELPPQSGDVRLVEPNWATPPSAAAAEEAMVRSPRALPQLGVY